MNNYNYINLPPFKWFVLQNFPFIEYDFDALTNWQLFCKLGKEMNKIIEKVNLSGEQVEKLTNAFNDLENYVNNYFESLNIQDEINAKLDEMAEDGTLAEIINQDLFTELNNKIDDNTNEINDLKLKTTKFPNFFVGAFFNGGFGNNLTTKGKFYCSLNGVDFTEFNKNSNINENYDLRDLSLQFDKNNKRFLLACTQYNEQMDCLIFSSNDFVNWEEHKINLGYMLPHENLHRWAPDLFIDDNGNIYLIISIEYNRIDNLPQFKQVLFKCNNSIDLTFERIGEIETEYNNIIDGTIAKYNNVYYLLVKNDDTSSLQLYRTNNIEYVGSYELVNSQVNFENLPLEGGCLCFTDDVLNIYAENFSKWHGYTLQQTKLSDFPTIIKNSKWLDSLTNKTYTTAPENFDARHGNVIYINDDEAKSIILNNTDINFTNTNAIKINNQTINFDFYYGNNPENVIVYPNVKYNLGNMSGTITIDNLINPYNCNNIEFLQSTQYLTININKINGVTVNLSYTNNGSNKGNVTILDLNSGRFLQPYKRITLTDITNDLSAVANISLLSGCNYNGTVVLDFIIKVLQTTSLNNVHIATLPDKFRPLFFNLPQHYVIPNQEIYIDGSGQIHADLRNCSVNQQIRCTAIFIPNN